MQSQLTGKDSDAGKDRRQKKKGEAPALGSYMVEVHLMRQGVHTLPTGLQKACASMLWSPYIWLNTSKYKSHGIQILNMENEFSFHVWPEGKHFSKIPRVSSVHHTISSYCKNASEVRQKQKSFSLQITNWKDLPPSTFCIILYKCISVWLERNCFSLVDDWLNWSWVPQVTRGQLLSFWSSFAGHLPTRDCDPWLFIISSSLEPWPLTHLNIRPWEQRNSLYRKKENWNSYQINADFNLYIFIYGASSGFKYF